MTDSLPDLHMQSTGQCFPLYYYPKKSAKTNEGDLFADETSDSCAGNSVAYSQTLPAGEKGLCPENGLPQPVYAITEKTVEAFRKVYPDAFAGAETANSKKVKDLGRFARRPAPEAKGALPPVSSTEIAPEDIFFYIYAVLHHPEYRARFADNLTKEMPRIPFLKGFTLYSYIGRMLAKLHVDYETAPMYPLKEEYAGDPAVLAENPGKITKLKFGKTKTADGKSVADKSVIICNENVVLSGIPASAYDYVVNGRSALEWLIDRYQITTAKGSGIVNDPNLYSDNPRYIIDLIKRVTHVSLETTKLIAMLPAWEECRSDS